MPRGAITKRSAPAVVAVAPTGPAGGDLSGNYPAPTVDGLQTVPISAAAPVNGDMLRLVGGVWTPVATPPDYFVALAADSNTVSAVPVVILTQNIAVASLRTVLFDVMWSCTVLAGTQSRIALYIDGVLQTGSGFSAVGVAQLSSGGHRWSAALAAGAHTIDVQWYTQGGAGQIFCRPVSAPDYESMSLTVRELYP